MVENKYGAGRHKELVDYRGIMLFKRSELAKLDASLIPVIELLQLWLSRSKVSVPTHFMYGKNNVMLTGAARQRRHPRRSCALYT